MTDNLFNFGDLVDSNGNKAAIDAGWFLLWRPREKTVSLYDSENRRIYFTLNGLICDDKKFVPEIATESDLMKVIEPLAWTHGLICTKADAKSQGPNSSENVFLEFH